MASEVNMWVQLGCCELVQLIWGCVCSIGSPYLCSKWDPTSWHTSLSKSSGLLRFKILYTGLNYFCFLLVEFAVWPIDCHHLFWCKHLLCTGPLGSIIHNSTFTVVKLATRSIGATHFYDFYASEPCSAQSQSRYIICVTHQISAPAYFFKRTGRVRWIDVRWVLWIYRHHRTSHPRAQVV